ncbi:MAG: release factor glutamine methyltransferase [Pseudomonadota bacterium]
MVPEAPLAMATGLSRGAVLRWAAQLIDRFDARLLLQHVTGCSAADLLAYAESPLSDEALGVFKTLVERRQQGEPVAYLTGVAGFYGDLLHVTSAVLVPRPETEELVSWSLDVIKSCPDPQVADLGTGSGAIALALAGARPDARILAIDISADALDVATANRDRLARDNVEVRCANWLEGIPEEPTFDLIVSNPPYIDAADPHLAGDGVRFEPRLALTDGGDGLSAYAKIVVQAMLRLNPGGWLLVEHGHDQREPVAALWCAAGLANVQSRQDLSGNPRMTAGQKPKGLEAGRG